MVGRLAAALLSVAALLALTQSASARQAQQLTCPFDRPATIVGTNGPDVLVGTPGNDVIVALDGDDRLDGLEGNDLLCGGPGVDQIFGGAGGDELYGELGNDEIDGGPEMDGILGGPGDDRLVGGDGIDVVAYFYSPVGVQVDLTSGRATGEGTDSLTGFEAVAGSFFNDVITGSAFGDFLFPLLGDDVVRGGAGFDIVSFLAPVQASLATGTAVGEGNDSLSGLEGMGIEPRFVGVLIGNGGDNFLQGSNGADTLRGSGGNDTIVGLGGDDRLTGGPGFDLVNGGPGSDNLDGGTGVGDTLSYIDAPTRVKVNLVDRTSVAGRDHDRFTGFEVVAGSQLNDVLTGDVSPNTLLGKGGNDRLLGARGSDFLDGGGGTDRLSGGPGDDYCVDGEKNLGCETKERTTTRPTVMRRASMVLDLGWMLARLDPNARAARGSEKAPGDRALLPLLRRFVGSSQATSTLPDNVVYTTPPSCPNGRGGKTSIEPPRIIKFFPGLGSGQTLIWQGQLTLGNKVVYETPVVAAVFSVPRLLSGAPAFGFMGTWHAVGTNRVYQRFSHVLTGNGRYLWKAVMSIEEVPGLKSLQTVSNPPPPPYCPIR